MADALTPYLSSASLALEPILPGTCIHVDGKSPVLAAEPKPETILCRAWVRTHDFTKQMSATIRARLLFLERFSGYGGELMHCARTLA